LCLAVSFPCNSSNIVRGRKFRVHLHNGEHQHVVVGGNAGGGLINDGLASGSSLPGRGGGEQGGGQREPRGQARTSLVLHGSEQLGPNGLSGAGHKRRRHETNDIGNATNGSSGEAEKTKKAKLETTRAADNTAVQRKEGNGSGNGGTCDSSDDSSNGGTSSAGRDKGIGGGGKEGILT
jgi:hypothetical protein